MMSRAEMAPTQCCHGSWACGSPWLLGLWEARKHDNCGPPGHLPIVLILTILVLQGSFQ